MSSCGGNNSTVVKGSLSGELDSLSYAIGSNIGYGLKYQMSDIPFDFKTMFKAIEDAALNDREQEHEEAYKTLNDFFMNKRGTRAREIANERRIADSTRLAQGDSTKVEYPVADSRMFESEEERTEVSRSLGLDFGYNMQKSKMPLQVVWVLEAIQNVNDNKSKFDEVTTDGILRKYFMETLPKQNLEASQKWLASIEKKSGVEKTESGLLYRIEKSGDMNVKANDDRDVVKVHYTGRTRTGEVFDSSIFANRPKAQQKMLKQQRPNDFDKDEPIEFPLNRVIKGWTEGMKLIGKGGKITLWLPADLAYGQRGAGGSIGPNEALEFEVELIDVAPYVEPAPAPEQKKEAETKK